MLSGIRFKKKINCRPGDVYYPNFLTGCPAFFDVSIRNSFQPSCVSKLAVLAGSAAVAGESEKDMKHSENVTLFESLFYPLVVKTFGFWTPGSIDTLKTIAMKTTTVNKVPFAQAYRNLMPQLSVSLWKFNSRLIWS